MLRTAFKSGAFCAAALMLAGCGLGQTVTDAAVSATQTIFYKQIKTLRLDFWGREALNMDRRESSSPSQPVMVRVLQLRDRRGLDDAVYQQLVDGGEALLGDALLASRAVVVKPGTAASLSMPMEAQAEYVAVVALFRDPDTQKDNWRLVLTREDLDPDKARVIEVGERGLVLVAQKK
ncbi:MULTISPECIES: type VI secretion system lipoprotein TssJ [Tenebrionibacter/Tenebrionicola group]|nr:MULTISPECIES: type VI secretion system lipoprotein TssJ [Tenebrionibacter/Tenebrionicola group]